MASRRGSIPVIAIEDVALDATNAQQFYVRTAGRDYWLRASTEADCDGWVRDLRSALQLVPFEEVVLSTFIDDPPGEFGTVRVAMLQDTFPVALKHLKLRGVVLDPGRLEDFKREVALVRSLSPHDHVATFKGWGRMPVRALTADDKLLSSLPKLLPFYCMERLEICLFNVLFEPSLVLSADQLLACLHQVAGGLQHLHSQGIVFGDLNTANLMCSDGWQFKVCVVG